MTTERRRRLGPEALRLVARRFQALAEPRRLALLQALFEGEATVTALCRATGTGVANASKHLAVLAAEGIVARRKEGLHVHYRVADPAIRRLCATVCGSLARRFRAAGEAFA